jgi:outer membrane receptor protein involved in Fe transport
MQNVGKVNIFGAESSFELNYKFTDKWNINSLFNYTFQLATDITDRINPTFGHQIAYLPKHTFNADISLKRKNTGFRWSTFGNSLRYSLNENNSANEVAGFVLSDVSVFTSVKLKKNNLRIQFSCKNIFNSSYAIVRYYVMPGRNYLISFNYAFN